MNLWCCVLHLDSLEPSYLPSGYPHQQRTGLPYKPVTLFASRIVGSLPKEQSQLAFLQF